MVSQHVIIDRSLIYSTVLLCTQVWDTELCFVNSHLAAHQDKVRRCASTSSCVNVCQESHESSACLLPLLCKSAGVAVQRSIMLASPTVLCAVMFMVHIDWLDV